LIKKAAPVQWHYLSSVPPCTYFQSYAGFLFYSRDTLDLTLKPYLDRHAAGNWGQLCAVDKRANDRAVKKGTRILSAYDVPLEGGETARIWIITEWDRSLTTALLPQEY
jgi:hypothetical protein